MNINIADLNDGKQQVFNGLYLEYKPKLFNYIFHKTGSEYYSDEVVQVTFTKLWENREHIKTDIPLQAQIFQIAKSSLIDILRKVERERLKIQMLEESESEADFGLKNIESITPIIWNIVEKKLPPVRSKVFMLRVKDQLSYQEISGQLNISVKTVARHINMGFQQIRFFLSEKWIS